MLKGVKMNREEIITKLTDFWANQLGKPSDFGDELITAIYNATTPAVTQDQVELFSKTLKLLLEEVESFDYFVLEVDYSPKSLILKKALDMALISKNPLLGKTTSIVRDGIIKVKCGYGGEFKELE